MLKVLVPCSIPLRPRGPAFGKLGHFSKVLGEKLRLRDRFLERPSRSTIGRLLLRVYLSPAFPRESTWLPRLKRKFSSRSRMCCSQISSVTRSCRFISNEQ